jgi:hypothetical protein
MQKIPPDLTKFFEEKRVLQMTEIFKEIAEASI